MAAAVSSDQAFINAAVVALLLIAFLGGGQTEAQDCGRVRSLLAPCVDYFEHGTPTPTSSDSCCTGARQLNDLATSQQARQSICRCLEQQAASINPLPTSVSGLPAICNVVVSYPLSPEVDCSRIS